MKKYLFSALVFTFFMTMSPNLATANTDPESAAVKEDQDDHSEKALALNNRLAEIQNMDMSTLERSEKKALKEETKTIKKELKAIGRGVYISTGAIIIIILLILLL
jgi:hypothetical protein